AGGVPNLEVIDLEGSAHATATRVTSAAFAPAPNLADSSVFFLVLHARGLDLRRIRLGRAASDRIVTLSSSLVPVVPNPGSVADSSARAQLHPRPYRAGPHQHRLLPGASYSAEGAFASLTLYGLDPVGRFAYSATGVFGERSAWRGASITASWRG